MKRLVTAVAAAVLALGWAGAAPVAQAATYSACNGVWVIIDPGALGGGVKTSCASSFSTGTAALRSAGFTPTLDNGFITKIDARPTSPNIQKAYWSYWHATRKSDGSYTGWSYSNDGGNAYHPTKGNAEGWHYVSLSDPASGPSVAPPKNPLVPASTAKPSAAKPTASKSASKPNSSTKPTASSNTATPSAVPRPTTSESAAPTPTVVAAPEATTGNGEGDSGSPLPLIITVVVVVAGGAGAGAWWLWRGRKH